MEGRVGFKYGSGLKTVDFDINFVEMEEEKSKKYKYRATIEEYDVTIEGVLGYFDFEKVCTNIVLNKDVNLDCFKDQIRKAFYKKYPLKRKIKNIEFNSTNKKMKLDNRVLNAEEGWLDFLNFIKVILYFEDDGVECYDLCAIKSDLEMKPLAYFDGVCTEWGTIVVKNIDDYSCVLTNITNDKIGLHYKHETYNADECFDNYVGTINDYNKTKLIELINCKMQEMNTELNIESIREIIFSCIGECMCYEKIKDRVKKYKTVRKHNDYFIINKNNFPYKCKEIVKDLRLKLLFELIDGRIYVVFEAENLINYETLNYRKEVLAEEMSSFFIDRFINLDNELIKQLFDMIKYDTSKLRNVQKGFESGGDGD